jgi:hypothetical protein
MAKTRFFLFGRGLHQDTDARIQDPDAPRAIENLVKRKNGRLGVRYDFDALTMTEQSGGTLTLYDLFAYDDRLFAMGKVGTGPAAPTDIAEYVAQPAYGWLMGEVGVLMRLSQVTNLTNLFTSETEQEVTLAFDNVVDVAAGSGRVVTVHQNMEFLDTVVVSLLDGADGSRLGAIDKFAFTDMRNPRVVCTGSKFFLSGVKQTTGAIKLFVLDPAVSATFAALPDPAGAGGAVQCFDMSLSNEGTTFVIAYSRTGPTTRIHEFDANGTETADFAGAAVAFSAICVFAEAINAGQKRVHVMAVVTATSAINLYTYILPTTALENTTLAIFGVNSSSQVSMCVLGSSTNTIQVAFSDTTTNVRLASFVNNTAVGTLGSVSWTNGRMDSKLINVGAQAFASLVIPQTSGTELSRQLCLLSTVATTSFPCAMVEPLFAHQSNAAQLPTLARDVSTGLVYWIRVFEVASRPGTSPEKFYTSHVLSRMVLGSTQRRQTAEVNDTIYIAGGAVQSFDFNSVSEAGFLVRPRIKSIAQGGGGSLTLLATYQVVAVYETFDHNGNRIQSAPSDVATVTMTGANNSLSTVVQAAHEIRGRTGRMAHTLLVLYRTLNNADGNLTFFRDADGTDLNVADVTVVLQNSDIALSAQEILYSQGARGALSGPLPFTPPDPAIAIAASADRIFTGGLPEASSVQESRPLFPSEQVNWSDGIGFKRGVRGGVLAVARLDERRIIFTSTEIFEMDGPGLDDNGNGDLGAPRRLPSDVGLYGGQLGWRSMVETSMGILFQGLADQIYLLPRGGTTPIPIGNAVQDQLALFPVIVAATYLPEDQTVRFTCNNVAGNDCINLLMDVRFGEWFVEGPFGSAALSANKFGGRIVMLRGSTVFQQRTTHPPASFISNAWRSGTIHPHNPGEWGRVYSLCFYGEYRGDCTLQCTVRYDDLLTEVLTPVGVGSVSGTALAVGDPYSHKFTPNEVKCESIRVDWDVTFPALQIVAETQQAFPTANISINVALPAARRIGDRVIIAFSANNIVGNFGLGTVPAGWTNLQAGGFTGPGLAVRGLERNLDGTEQDSVLILLDANGGVGAALAKVWLVRGHHTGQATQAGSLASNGAGSATTLDIGLLTPAWGAAANLWLFFAAIESDNTPPQITSFPAGFTSTGELQNVSATQALDGTIGWGSQILNAASLDPSVMTYTNDGVEASRSLGFLLAIRPAIVSEGLAYHYWTMDTDPAGKSALKAPQQMS